MILSTAQMRAAEQAAFARGCSEESLMESAGAGAAARIRFWMPYARSAVVAVGKGHNGGDGLVIARELARHGWKVAVALSHEPGTLSPLAQKQLSRLPDEVLRLAAEDPWDSADVVVDALLGIGASGSLRGGIADLCARIHAARNTGSRVFSIDVPTGLDSDTGDAAEGSVMADMTLAIGFVKQGLVRDVATSFAGRIERVLLPQLNAPDEYDPARVTDAGEMRLMLPRRAYESHKGNYGRVGIVAGSCGMLGAARLASAAAVRAGAGWVRLYAHESVYPILAGAAIPEVMVKPVADFREVIDEQANALVIGPGLGPTHANAVRELIRSSPVPAVIDADALRMLAESPTLLRGRAAPSLLTPHPGEMKALCARGDRDRVEWCSGYANEFNVCVLLKGARTVICSPGKPARFNGTGGPALAKGGSGDVLAGVCGALMAQGLNASDAAAAGAWLCGMAADLFVLRKGLAEESFTAQDIISLLPEVFALRWACGEE
jgi:hydroxyethylthiazole kinase-like uncharacterized protein yjeF